MINSISSLSFAHRTNGGRGKKNKNSSQPAGLSTEQKARIAELEKLIPQLVGELSTANKKIKPPSSYGMSDGLFDHYRKQTEEHPPKIATLKAEYKDLTGKKYTTK
jgi:hypothetical protein